MRIGSGHDIHRLGAERPLIIAGVKLSDDGGPHGHSDGDVAFHALIDAMLGAVALGDIGGMFPDTDERYAGADSAQLTRQAFERVSEQGYGVGNIDITVFVKRPKLSPHITNMRQNVADVLGLDINRVSIKAKSGNGVGPVGEGSAVEARANVLMVPHE